MKQVFSRSLRKRLIRPCVEQQVDDIFNKLMAGRAAACQSELEEIEGEFKTKVAAWAWERRASTFFGDDLRIEPYTRERAETAHTSENNTN